MKKKMRMIEPKIRAGLVAVVFLFISSCEANVKINCRVIRVGNGWGYELFSGEKVMVHQEIIPAIQGEFPFVSRRDARKTGKLALYKMANCRLPVITQHDLDSMKIVFPETLLY
jgi:hypothetical protein